MEGARARQSRCRFAPAAAELPLRPTGRQRQGHAGLNETRGGNIHAYAHLRISTNTSRGDLWSPQARSPCFAGYLRLPAAHNRLVELSILSVGHRSEGNLAIATQQRRTRLPTPLHLRLRTEDPDNILSPLARMVHDQCERRNLDVRRRRKYTAVVLHFGYWLADRGVAMDSFTTDHVESFLADHATGCSCSCIWRMRTEVES